MSKWFSSRRFSLIGGSVLFIFGIVGFSFRSSFDIGAQYLFASLVLGFWGIVSAATGG